MGPNCSSTRRIIAEKTPFTERCEAMLTALDGDLAKPLEPTYEELNPPPPPKKEYRFSLGDTVYLGAQEYELLSFDEQEVRLYDVEYPLFNKTMPREEFDRKIAENPQNDHLLVVVEEQGAPVAAAPEDAAKKYDLGYGAMGNGFAVWNRLEEENGDYKTVAQINSDRSVVFYDVDMPESVKAQIRDVAAIVSTQAFCRSCGKAIENAPKRKPPAVLLRRLPDEMVERPSRCGEAQSILHFYLSALWTAV